MIDGNMTVGEWLENQRKANEKLALDIIDQKQYQIDKLEEENKMLHKEQWRLHRLWSKDTKHIAELEEENKKLKETIKDHQLYEEKLEHRIIEFEELLHWE